DVGRAAVLAHLAAHGLESVDDATNRDTKFLRNRVRHELLPLLAEKVGARTPDALRRVARASREAVEALDALVPPRLPGPPRRSPQPAASGLAAPARRPGGSPGWCGEGDGAPRACGDRRCGSARKRSARAAPRRAGRAPDRHDRGARSPAPRSRGRTRARCAL